MSRPPGYHATRYALLVAFLVTCVALAVVIRLRWEYVLIPLSIIVLAGLVIATLGALFAPARRR